MKKILLLSTILAIALYAQPKTEAEIFYDGFVAAKKAIERDYETQGDLKETISTRKYIIYADVSKFSDNKKLMIQLLGIKDSYRTTNQWIIFDSFDSLPNAKEELEFLKNKYFSNKEDIVLNIFDNKDNKRFRKDYFILKKSFSEIKKDMQAKIEEEISSEYKLKLIEKQQELEENQKIAVVYIDKEPAMSDNSKKQNNTQQVKQFFTSKNSSEQPTYNKTPKTKSINMVVASLKNQSVCDDEHSFLYKNKEYKVGDLVEGKRIKSFRIDISNSFKKFKISFEEQPEREYIIASIPYKQQNNTQQVKQQILSTDKDKIRSEKSIAITSQIKEQQNKVTEQNKKSEKLVQKPSFTVYKIVNTTPTFVYTKDKKSPIDSAAIKLYHKQLSKGRLIKVDKKLTDENGFSYYLLSGSNFIFYADDAVKKEQ